MDLPIERHQTVIYKCSAYDTLSSTGCLPRQQLEACFRNGAVWLQTRGKPQRLYDSQTPVKPGNSLHLYCNESTLAACPYRPDLIQDLGSFSIWFKPSGMLSQGSKWGDHWTLARWVHNHYFQNRGCYITHRLDRFTSGLMIVAHDNKTNRQFHRLFEQQQMEKTYRAIVKGLVDEQSMTIDQPVHGKSACTEIHALQQDPLQDLTLIEAKPRTGRKHQIRLHLAHIGHPVLNDRQYGQPPFNGDLQLQSCSLQFDHPVDGESLHFSVAQKDLLHL
jgi:tRNA pseudouridine32 synthase/23S rRNA pseudouridine746 synthase